MKVWELNSGIDVVVFGEEEKVLEKFLKTNKPKLNEREKVIAGNLVKKDILTKTEIDGDEVYFLKQFDDVWRD